MCVGLANKFNSTTATATAALFNGSFCPFILNTDFQGKKGIKNEKNITYTPWYVCVASSEITTAFPPLGSFGVSPLCHANQRQITFATVSCFPFAFKTCFNWYAHLSFELWLFQWSFGSLSQKSSQLHVKAATTTQKHIHTGEDKRTARTEKNNTREKENNANKLKSQKDEAVNLLQYFYIQYDKQNFW